MQNNTLIDLFQRIKDLLRDNKTDVVHNVAKKSDLSQKLRDTFSGLAELIERKNSEIKNAADINYFYRECITKIRDRDVVTEASLLSEWDYISEGIRKHILDLEYFVAQIFTSVQRSNSQSKIYEKETETYLFAMKDITQKSDILSSRLMEKERLEDLLKDEIEDLTKKNKLLNARLTEESRKIQSYQQEISDLTEKNKRFRSEIQDLLERSQRYEEEISALTERNQHFKEEISVLTESNNLSNAKLMESVSQVSKVKEQMQALNQRSEILNAIPQIERSSELPRSLLLSIKDYIGQIGSYTKIYNYQHQRKQSFNDSIYGRENLLLVCYTTDDKIIGGFTTAAFSLNEEPVETKAFLFGLEDDQISLRRLKSGRKSIIYDPDFLVFGNEEICIEQGQCELTSYIPHNPDSHRHFDNPKGQDYFLKSLGEKGRTALNNYEVYTISFS